MRERQEMVDQEIASRAFRIVGIFKAEMEATEKQFVFVTLPAGRRGPCRVTRAGADSGPILPA